MFYTDFDCGYELNREWLYDEDDEIIGERNFVVKVDYFNRIFSELFPNENLDEFLDWYEPETDGEKIYQKALSDGETMLEFVTFHQGGAK